MRAQFLVYPMLDHRTATSDAPDDDPTTGEFVWTLVQDRNAWQGIGGDRTINGAQLGYFSPAVADRLDGLPPTMIVAGSLDVFRIEDSA